MTNLQDQDNTQRRVRPGIYHHFKGHDYMVVGIAQHTETGEELVVYRPLYSIGQRPYGLLVRPLNMFIDHVEREDYKGPRFRLIRELEEG